MNLNTDNNKSSLKGVYMFYSVVITLCILALFVFDLNIYAKAVLCTLVFLCVLIMRSLKKAIITVEHGGAIDLYLTLLIETDEEMSNDPTIDKSAPNYNNLLNHRIGLKLDAMLKSNNHSNKD